MKLFRTRLADVFGTTMQDEEQIFLSTLLESVNEGLSTGELFGTAEATEGCLAMQEAEELMISEGIVYKI